MLRTRTAIFGAVGLFTAAVVACDFSPNETFDPAESACQAIIDACEPVDLGTGPVHDCVIFGTTQTSEAECVKRRPSCLATCDDAVEGTGDGDGDGDGDGEEDAGPDLNPKGPTCEAIYDECADLDRKDAGPVHDCVVLTRTSDSQCSARKTDCIATCKKAGENHLQAPSCEEIIAKCHDLDPGDGPIHECHVFAESDKTEAECAGRKAKCLTDCVLPPPDP